jgi:surface protein
LRFGVALVVGSVVLATVPVSGVDAETQSPTTDSEPRIELMAAPPAQDPFCGFLDNPWSSYFSEASCWLKEEGITTGTTSYNPSWDVTRAQMAGFLYRAAGSPAVANYVFKDEAQIPSWARVPADWLKAQGITTNDPYRPNDRVSRAEMAAFLWRAAGSPAARNHVFRDEAAIPAYARPASDWLKAQGITVNDPYSPRSNVTRAQMAAFLWRAEGRPPMTTLPDPSALVLWFDTTQGDRTVDVPLGTGDVTINWGDGTATQSTAGNQVVSHTYATNGYYRVVITGTLAEFGGFDNAVNSDPEELVAVSQFGNLGVTSLGYAFAKAPNLTRVNQKLPGSVDNLQGIFSGTVRECVPGFDPDCPVSPASAEQPRSFRNYEALGEDISQWDTSGITDMSYMFSQVGDYNGEYLLQIDISGWDTSNVTDMEAMFEAAYTFNQDLSGWDVSNVTNMRRMFIAARAFQSDLSNWDVSNVTNMDFMFAGSDYNGDISGWNLASLESAEEMFSYVGMGMDTIDGVPQRVGVGRTAGIAGWAFPAGANLNRMFAGADMTGRLSNWDVSGVVSMDAMFAGSPTFNQDLSGWDVRNVTSAHGFAQEAQRWVLPRPRFLDIYTYGLLTYGDGTWLAAGTVQDIELITPEVDFRRSTNGGTTWSKAGSPGQNPDNQWMSVAFGNGNWVAVSRNGTNRIVYSTDGAVSWKNAQVPDGDRAGWWSVAYGNGVWLAASPTPSRLIRSLDGGATWTEVSLPSADLAPRSVAYGDGVWIATDSNGGSVLRSSDGGVTWDIQTATATGRLTSLAFADGIWLAFEYRNPMESQALIRSTDGGISWDPVDASIPGPVRPIHYGGGTWRMPSRVALYPSLRSDDGGLTWASEDSLGAVNGLGFGAGKWLAHTTNGFIEVSTTP